MIANAINTKSAAAEAGTGSFPAWIAGAVKRIAEGRRRAAEREVARFITSQGSRLTDDVERRIARGLI